MPESTSTEKKKRPGCLSCIGFLLLLVFFVGMIIAVIFVATPQDVTDIKGRSEALQNQGVRDLAEVLRMSHDKGHQVVVREAELNRWLHQTLQGKQEGILGEWVTITGVWVRISDGYAELIQEREALGRTFTISMFLRLEVLTEDGKQLKRFHLNNGPFLEAVPMPRRGGRLGKLTVPEGFLMFVLPSYKQLAELYRREIRLAFQEMSEVRFEKGRITLTPWPKTAGVPSQARPPANR